MALRSLTSSRVSPLSKNTGGLTVSDAGNRNVYACQYFPTV